MPQTEAPLHLRVGAGGWGRAAQVSGIMEHLLMQRWRRREGLSVPYMACYSSLTVHVNQTKTQPHVVSCPCRLERYLHAMPLSGGQYF